ncbi:MAG: leucine-rich repeat domain-containing protein, partial [Candidatus Helarchaeota archaeon]
MASINEIFNRLSSMDKASKCEFLKNFIFEAIIGKERLKALEKFMEVDDGSNYEFLEQLFLSDEDRKVRMLAGKLLLGRYSNQKQLLTLLKFTLDNINDIYQKILALEFLNKIGNKSAIKIIIDYMKRVSKKLFGKKVFRDNGIIFSRNSFTDRILNEGILKVGEYSTNSRLLSKEELDTCINLCLHDHYINILGYHATFKSGTIILLNCEGMGLTRISDIIGIERLGELEHLMLQRNNIREIDGLEHLKSLKVLNLSGNKIKKIE